MLLCSGRRLAPGVEGTGVAAGLVLSVGVASGVVGCPVGDVSCLLVMIALQVATTDRHSEIGNLIAQVGERKIVVLIGSRRRDQCAWRRRVDHRLCTVG